MASRLRAVDEARRSWHRRRVEIGAELRTSRGMRGASQAAVALAVDASVSVISRRELGTAANVSVLALAEHAAAVGLKLAINLYPAGGGVRDEAQLRYIDRFLERTASAFTHEVEAVIPLPGDLRAVDVVLRAPGCVVAVEVITRFTDAQAQVRTARLKARDIGATRLVIVLAATHANRRALEAARPALVGAWDLDSRRVLSALGDGRSPDRDAVILI